MKTVHIANDLLRQEKIFFKSDKNISKPKCGEIIITFARLIDLKLLFYFLSMLPYKDNNVDWIEIKFDEFVEFCGIGKTYKKGKIDKMILESANEVRKIGFLIRNQTSDNKDVYDIANIIDRIRIDEKNRIITAFFSKNSLPYFNGSMPYKKITPVFIKAFRNLRDINFYLWLRSKEIGKDEFPENVLIEINQFKRKMEERGDINRMNIDDFDVIETSSQRKEFLKTFFRLSAKNNEYGYLNSLSSLKSKSIVDFINETDLNLRVGLVKKRCPNSNKDIFYLNFMISFKDEYKSTNTKEHKSDLHSSDTEENQYSNLDLDVDVFENFKSMLLHEVVKNEVYKREYDGYIKDLVFIGYDSDNNSIILSSKYECIKSLLEYYNLIKFPFKDCYDRTFGAKYGVTYDNVNIITHRKN